MHVFWLVGFDYNQNFLIGFLDELDNFKQKKFTFQNVNFFLHFTATDPFLALIILVSKIQLLRSSLSQITNHYF